MYLHELSTSIRKLDGVGPKRLKAFSERGVLTIADLLLYLPRRYEDRSSPRALADAGGELANTVAQIIKHEYFGQGRNRTLKLIISDGTQRAALVCFGRAFLADSYPPGSVIRVSAVFQYRYRELQAANFEIEPAPGETVGPPRGEQSRESALFFRIVPVYPLSSGLSQHHVRTAIALALDHWGHNIQDELPETLREAAGVPSAAEALGAMHRPERFEDAERGRRRFALQELLALQFAQRRLVAALHETERPPRTQPRGMLEALLARLPFALSAEQHSVLDEILTDLGSPRPMARLLHGEVGSGKTVISLLSMAPRLELGEQTAVLVPTELLARQQYETLRELLEPQGVRVELAVGKLTAQERRALHERIAEGNAHCVVGTHALLTPQVQFRALSYVVIDEQHRFGVAQRAALREKGAAPDVLLMTATPIPRTLALTLYNGLEISQLRDRPPGRRTVTTHLARRTRRAEVYAHVASSLREGGQAFVVCPRIEADENGESASAEETAEELAGGYLSEFSIGLIHGRLSEEQKRSTMQAFTAGRIQVLVSTTVLEVGVDVENAVAIVIEHADRFGLSALHQLRGRVGRGLRPGVAFLVYGEELTEDAKQRLRVLHQEQDGFAIAEHDLKIRGPGELGGVRQAGMLRLRFTELERDLDLLERAATAVTSVSEHPVLERSLLEFLPFTKEEPCV